MDHKDQPSQEEILHLIALKEVFGGFAHDIAQPLNAIGIACQIMQLKIERSALPETERGFLLQRLEIVSSQVQKASDILARFSAFHRQDKFPVERQDIAGIFNKIFKLMEQQLSVRGIVVGVESQEGFSLVQGDWQVIEGLIVQGVAFARDTVSVVARWHEKSGLAYVKRLDVALAEVEGFQSMQVTWDLGQFPDDLKSLEPSLHTGLLVAESIVVGMGGRLEVGKTDLKISLPTQA
ncbi:MAG: hypothetical protein HY914_16640 [Desulfomonile tiedjei]|nr:hypothetical protein [Desulfomonile tiedjei]